MATKKLTQQELRELMKERAASKQKPSTARIESPLARYDDKQRLSCVICNVVIHSESLWPAHLAEKTHRKKLDELREHRNKINTVASVQPKAPSTSIPTNKSQEPQPVAKKRVLSSASISEKIENKVSKFLNVSEFTKKETTLKKIKVKEDSDDEDEEEKPSDVQEEGEGTILDADLPTDFFDSGVKPTFVPTKSSTVVKSEEKKTNETESTEAGALPRGFFDDPFKDKMSQKDHKTEMDLEMEMFRKQIAEEVLLSEQMVVDDNENLQREKEIEEVEEQYFNWKRVDTLQKKVEQMRQQRCSKAQNQTSQSSSAAKQESDDEDDSDDDVDDGGENFWRNKRAFV